MFKKITKGCLPFFEDRWTPLYLEHGRIEVDGFAVKFVSAENYIVTLPVSTISALLLGCGTTITQEATKACANSNCSLLWVGEDGFKFYSQGIITNSTNENAKKQVINFAQVKKRTLIAKKMFQLRFGVDVDKTIAEFRGMEGVRVKQTYELLGNEYCVDWKGRRYSPENFEASDEINRALTIANQYLYAIVCSMVCCLGYLPQIGFVHSKTQMSFVFDIADLYKATTSIPSAFEFVSSGSFDKKDLVIIMQRRVEEIKLNKQILKDLNFLFGENNDNFDFSEC